MSKTVKIGPTLSQISLSIVGKTAYLGGNVCMEIPSDYRAQLSDHQELFRSSQNHSQKMTPRHGVHSGGLSSRAYIS